MALPPDQNSAFTALNRFGLGPKPDTELSKISADPRGFLKEELGSTSAALSAPSLTDTKSGLQALYAQQAEKKMMREQTSPSQGMDKSPLPQQPKDMGGMNVQRDVYQDEAMARFLKAYAEPSGLIERLVWFWSNHFCVSVAKGQNTMVTAGSFEREAISPNILGNFSTMLRAVEQHPAMLYYLDNQQSIGPNSKAGLRRGKGLNENLAREIMELHTLGVDSGYTQGDVTSLARIITGWTIVGRNAKDGEPGTFAFNPNYHEPGNQTLLGKTYVQMGIDQGKAALNNLAASPATANHLAFKLARHFVADEPPPVLVDRLSQSFQKTAGDLKSVIRTLIDSDEAWATPPTKLKNPQEFLLSSSRAIDLQPDDPRPWLNALATLGQPLWRPSGPNGFGDTNEVWTSPEGIKVRLDVASLLARKTKSEISPNDLATQICGPGISLETKQAVARAESKPQALTLLLMSPEFQRR